MKVIIDIPIEIYDYLQQEKYNQHLENRLDVMSRISITDGTPIPDNATNGDIIKALFPNVESRLDEKTGIMLVKWVDGTTKTFKESWWNAPFKESEK